LINRIKWTDECDLHKVLVTNIEKNQWMYNKKTIQVVFIKMTNKVDV